MCYTKGIMMLLRCVDVKETELILKEVHKGTFGTHMNGHSMARKILRARYFWLTMETDCCIHVRKCHKCQAYADNINVTYNVKGSIRTLGIFHIGHKCYWSY